MTFSNKVCFCGSPSHFLSPISTSSSCTLSQLLILFTCLPTSILPHNLTVLSLSPSIVLHPYLYHCTYIACMYFICLLLGVV